MLLFLCYFTEMAPCTDAVRTRGFIFMERQTPEVSTELVAGAFGSPIALSDGPAVHSLTPKRQDEATPNSYSSLYGLGAFPLHTDFAIWHTPPRYLLLRCVAGFSDVTTQLLDVRPLARQIERSHLARAIMKPRRPVNKRISLLPLLQEHSGEWFFRWDELFLSPASKVGRKCTSELKALLADAPKDKVCLARPGDMLLIDNWKMLHGRSPVSEQSRGRKIERIYLQELDR